MVSLIRQIAETPGTGHNNDRADIPKLPRHAFANLRRMRCLACRSLCPGAEDDSIERLIRSRNMNLIDLRVIAQIGPFSRPASYDAQIARLDQGAHPLLNQGSQILIDRVRFVEHHLILLKELVEDIEWANTGNIACAQHQRDLATMLFVVIYLRLSLHYLPSIHTGFH